jgi:di/tricarboxylate transporter
MTFAQIYVLIVVAFLVYALYKELFNPALTFFICTVAFLVGGIIKPADALKGLSSQTIIIIFLLVIVTSGIRNIYGTDLFAKLFHERLKPKQFLLRMMMFVSTISAFLNNTPIVAFMIPYVQDWSRKTGHPASKFLIPLSFATILGGMMTVIGTSTNLVLNGLIIDYKLTALGWQDFLFLGIIVTLMGWAYLYFIGYNILPSNSNKLEQVRGNIKEYIVETEIFPDSKLAGKSVKDAGLRNLSDLFLVEIIRDDEVISPVTPDLILRVGDNLFFSGKTESIYELINKDNGIGIPEHPINTGNLKFNFVEAVIPANSELINKKIKDSDFRKRYDASIVAVHRDGKRVSGKVGETVLSGGDFLLLLAGNHIDNTEHEKDVFFLSVPKVIGEKKPVWMKYMGWASFATLIAGVIFNDYLFYATLLILCAFIFFKVLSFGEIKRDLDLGLVMVLVCSFAVGYALEKSGTATLIAGWLIDAGKTIGPVAALAALFMVTIMLTSLITNAAAVAIVFPIAMSMASQLGLSATPFFVAIAFAASGDFMTPIGYQTNLMIYGPGGYVFKDFVRVGWMFTILYVTVCVGFISWFYNLA